jgi:hypothetical protein
MKPILAFVLIASLLSGLSGCIVRTRAGGRGRACPPAHHWDGYACVHNGHGRGNGNGNGNGPVIRDHRH